MNRNDKTLIASPYSSYQKWRDENPIWWSDGDLKGWVLSRYDDVRTVMKDAKTFSSKSMGEMESQTVTLPLLTDDPPRHTQLRAIVNTAFTTRTLKVMESGVKDLAEELLDAMISGDEIHVTLVIQKHNKAALNDYLDYIKETQKVDLQALHPSNL